MANRLEAAGTMAATVDALFAPLADSDIALRNANEVDFRHARARSEVMAVRLSAFFPAEQVHDDKREAMAKARTPAPPPSTTDDLYGTSGNSQTRR
ncbi:hypothetical protein CTA1_8499 [Colletotrichum tanaceti]|uniref:Uncharacterized protein n=1 Tax=Colletotrichum tanaceti TaxID=1306861 RepID=A0A4U6X533_9PEZI|nr:hypothetical protein CTA1_8499 [Colletotrichum tanaceti]